MKSKVNKEYTANLGSHTEVVEPELYQVVIKNDDFTPKDFVISLLEKFFFMDWHRAAAIVQEAHSQGSAICGLFSKDFAESKATQITEYAHLHEHPLLCSAEARC